MISREDYFEDHESREELGMISKQEKARRRARSINNARMIPYEEREEEKEQEEEAGK